jgi:hypothetical protein
LPQGYSVNNEVADTSTLPDGTIEITVHYLGNGFRISFGQSVAPIGCSTVSNTGIPISNYSVFSPDGFDPGCSFVFGNTTTGQQIYTWGKNGTEFILESNQPFTSQQDAVKIAESLTYGKIRSNLFSVLELNSQPEF